MHTAFLFALLVVAAPAELRVPAFTAYMEPRDAHEQISEHNDVNHWRDPKQVVVWYGEIKTPGALSCKVVLRGPVKKGTTLRLAVAGQSHEAEVTGEEVEFKPFRIAAAGYQRFALELASGKDVRPEALVVSGPAADEAHFNLKERRNAASVHLAYPTPKDAKVAAFYCEVTAIKDPVPSYYMATGWHRGYFGMQVNSPTERRIIFSVWDSGNEAIDRNKVGAADRTTLIAKGPGVEAGDFGHEGTGGHSHRVYPWKTGERQRFIVTAKPTDATHTIYAGYWFHPEKKAWQLISAWKSPKDGEYLHGLYSFNEDFGGTGNLQRKALFGNQWIRLADGQWQELTTASFSHDPTGKADRLDRFMGVEKNSFFLSNGGFVPGFTRFGEKFTRPASGKPPKDLELPALPE
jgi:hypothetical protein